MKKKLRLINPNILLSESVAIIGNSSCILNKKFGKVIDGYDDVVRFNKAKLESYESYVGTKTTLRVINNGTFECNKTRPGLGWEKNNQDYDFALKLKNMKILIISPNKINKEIKRKNKVNSNQYFFLENKYIQFLVCFKFLNKIDIFFSLIGILFKGKNFSVGFYFILICIISKIKPKLFGFDLSEDMTKRSHYWQKAGNVGKFHNLSSEHQIINKFLKLNYIELQE